MFKGFGKKTRFFFAILAIVGILALAGCGGSSNQAAAPKDVPKEAPQDDFKPVTLNLAHMWSATHEVETVIVKNWAAEIEKATGGKVKIASFPGSTLIPPPEIYDGIVKGVADIGIGVYSYTRGRFPVIESFLIPGINVNNSKAATLALTEGIAKLDPKELKDTKQMFSWAAGPGDLVTKKPIKTMADLKGMQIGATAGLRADAVGLLGAAPVVQPMPEWYESLSKGVMQGGVAPLEVLKGFRLGEVTGDYITLTPFLYNQAFFIVMNNDKWNSLPADVQKAIEAVNKKFVAETVAPLWDELNGNGYRATKDKKKVEVTSLSAEETAKWVEKLKPLEEKYQKELDGKGLPGADIIKTVKELTDKYNAQFPDRAPYTK